MLILDYFTTPKKNYRAFFMGLPNSFLPVPPPEVLRPGVSAMFSWALCVRRKEIQTSSLSFWVSEGQALF